jgi:hypothetical protein
LGRFVVYVVDVVDVFGEDMEFVLVHEGVDDPDQRIYARSLAQFTLLVVPQTGCLLAPVRIHLMMFSVVVGPYIDAICQ